MSDEMTLEDWLVSTAEKRASLLFRMARAIWDNENPEAKPKQKDYPLTIKLNETTKEK